MPSPEYKRYRDRLLAFPKPELSLELLRDWMDYATAVDPATTSVTAVDAGGVGAEWVCHQGCDPDRRLLYLHGGGYVSGNPARYRAFAEVLSRQSGLAVLVPDYRLGPENPFPAAVDDAIAAYRWMCNHAPDGRRAAAKTFIAGDSAGGGLTLATLLALRDLHHPMATAAATLSAYTDLAHTGESVRTNDGIDPICPATWLPFYADNYLCGADPHRPLASPLYADLAGLPPLLMQVGGTEVILDDSVRFAKKARTAGVDVTLSVWPEMLHVFPVHIGDFPEAAAGAEEIAAYFRAR